jgi:tetratricopeptide (TPR) repeat protein
MGGQFLRIGLLDSAVASYSAAIALNPRVAAVHNGLGSARYFISTLAANPNYAERMNIHDPAHYIKAQYDSAIAEYTAAISLDSSCVDALTNRGVLRDIHDDHAGAIADYTLAIRTRPSYAEAYCKRAATYKRVGKYKQAIADYTAAIKLGSSSYEFDPTLHFANAYFSRGVAYYKTGDLGKAMADFDSTLVLSPKHSLAILSRAIALGDQKRYDSAIVGCTQAIALLAPSEYDGARELAYLQRGNAFRAKGEYDKAIADYTSALGSPKLAAKSCWRIADCYSLKHESATAIAWLRKSVSHGFSDFRAWKRDRDLSPLWNTREFRDIAG